MKTNDLLLYGGIGLAAYFLFIKPKQTVPSTTALPGTAATNPGILPATNSTAPTNLITSISNVLHNLIPTNTGAATSNLPATNSQPLSASGTTAIDQTLTTTTIPVDFPPGELAGFIQEEYCN